VLMSSLWESSSKPKLQAFQPPQPVSPLSPNPNQVLGTEAGPSRPRSNSVSAGTTEEREEGLVPSLEDLDISEPQIPKQNLSSSEISTLLTLSLLQSLQSPPSLPIPASLLYSAHILPNRPSYIPVGNRDEVVIAKSEWKKLGKWMKEVSKDGLIKIKETKGEVIVISYVSLSCSIRDEFKSNTDYKDRRQTPLNRKSRSSLDNRRRRIKSIQESREGSSIRRGSR
jgi:translation initiation factor 2D